VANTLNLLWNGAVGFVDWLGMGSLFSIIIICLNHPKTLALWLREPLVAIGIMDDIGKRVVSDDIINQVIAPDVPQLVCLLWRMDKYITNANGYRLGWSPHLTSARNNNVKLPLSRVRMKRPSGAIGWNSD
jgi:hypothetical protein